MASAAGESGTDVMFAFASAAELDVVPETADSCETFRGESKGRWR